MATKKFLVLSEGDWRGFAIEDEKALKDSLNKDGMLTGDGELILAEIDEDGIFCDYRSYDERDVAGAVKRQGLGILTKYDCSFEWEAMFAEKLYMVDEKEGE